MRATDDGYAARFFSIFLALGFSVSMATPSSHPLQLTRAVELSAAVRHEVEQIAVTHGGGHDVT